MMPCLVHMQNSTKYCFHARFGAFGARALGNGLLVSRVMGDYLARFGEHYCAMCMPFRRVAKHM
jgi:hypothetical protein